MQNVSARKGPFRVLHSCGSSDLRGALSPQSDAPSFNHPSPIDAPNAPPLRQYDCSNYETCLDLAAALDWESFSCNGCCGKINECLVWQAHQVEKYDAVAHMICDHLPPLSSHRIKQEPSNQPDPVNPTAPVAIKR